MPWILLYLATAALYAAIAAVVWRGEWRGSADGAPPAWLRGGVLVPLVLHAALLYRGLFAQDVLHFGFGHALSVMLWLAVAIYWVESLYMRLDGLQALVLPVAAVAVLLPWLFPGFALNDQIARALGFRLHLATAMAAYSFFTIAALQAVLMAMLERQLHSGALSGPFSTLPPLLTLERVLFQVIGAGFVLLSLTIASGALFSEQVFGRAWRFDHKTMFAIISWVIFAALLVGRYRYGWRGRTALRWIFAGFVTLLLAYVGSRFVLEVVLQRGAA
jgi:ABC-type uncharacterized transport system permease subunit